MTKKKQVLGRPKVPWEYFEEELDRRLRSGDALETVQAEAKYFAKWLIEEGMVSPNTIGFERIRERIKKRLGGSTGYKRARHYHRMLLGLE